MKIYFAGAIRAGREKVDDYIKFVERFENNNCIVLDKHVVDKNLSAAGEKNTTPKEIYERDSKWIKECDILFADVTIPSLGIGYEICLGKQLGKKIYAVYEKNVNVSGFLRGDEYIEFLPYDNIDEVIALIDAITKK